MSDPNSQATTETIEPGPRSKPSISAVQTPRELTKPRAPDGCPYLLNIPGGSLYLVRRPEGSYRWVEGKHASSVLNDMWPGGDWWKENKKTGAVSLLSIVDLMSTYGYLVDEHHYTWVLQGPEFRIDHRGVSHLQLLCGHDQAIPAVFHPECEEWIERLGGAKVDQVRDWLSVLRRLNEPVAALYIMGPGGIGKGMLSMVLAKLFGETVAKYETVVLGGYNSALTKTPVVIINEKVPSGQDGSAAFRDFIGGSSFELKVKFRSASTIKISPRCLICANNADALRLGQEQMNAGDEEAIARRIVFIEVDPSVKDWMAEVGGLSHTRDWIERPDGSAGKLVEHIQWYTENWEIVGDYKHMLVDGNMADWKRLTHKRAGIGEAIYGAIAMALVGMVEIQAHQSPVQLDSAGMVMVSARLMADNWKTLTKSSKTHTYSRMGKEMGKLAGEKNNATRKINGHSRQRVHLFEPQAIYDAALEAGVVEMEALSSALGLDTICDIVQVDA